MATPPIRVAILGATGNTGRSIVDGLLASPTDFDITALTRPSSLASATNAAFRARGVTVTAFDPLAPIPDLAAQLRDSIRCDVLVSAIHWTRLEDQLPLIAAIETAASSTASSKPAFRVPRFVPCAWGTAAPPGVMALHDRKLAVLAAAQRARLPWTSVDVGWWYDGAVPPLPSGRTDGARLRGFNDVVFGAGDVPTAFTDLGDVGAYVAKIVVDERTLNRSVLAYTEVRTLAEVWELVGEVSGEVPERKVLPASDIQAAIDAAHATIAAAAAHPDDPDPEVKKAIFARTVHEYWRSLFVRGDNTPNNAKYLGYLTTKELYPELAGRSMREFFEKVVEGKHTGPYAGMQF